MAARIPINTATSAPRAAQPFAVGEASQTMSKMTASSQAPIGTSVIAGCRGWPSQVPCRNDLKRRGGLRFDPMASLTAFCKASLIRSVKTRDSGGSSGSGLSCVVVLSEISRIPMPLSGSYSTAAGVVYRGQRQLTPSHVDLYLTFLYLSIFHCTYLTDGMSRNMLFPMVCMRYHRLCALPSGYRFGGRFQGTWRCARRSIRCRPPGLYAFSPAHADALLRCCGAIHAL